MNLLQQARLWAIKALGGQRYGRILSLEGLMESRHWPNLSVMSNQLDVYRKSPWVYYAASRIARDCALVNFNVFQAQGEQKNAIVNHPAEQLLRHPSTWVSQFNLMENTIADLQLTGNAYWLLDGPAGGQPTEIMTLQPDRVRVVATSDSKVMVSGYVYTVEGVEVPLEAAETIHFKRYHPKNRFYGMSPLEAAALSVQSDEGMAKWQRGFFGRDVAVPAGVVNIKTPIDDDVFERIKVEWRESYGGPERKTAFIREAEASYQTIGLNQTDMDFVAGRTFEKETIFLIFGIPAGLMDKNATEANALASLETYTRDTLWPQLVEVAQTLTSFLMPFWGANLLMEPDDIRLKDAASQRADIQAAAPYMTINEIRQQHYNLPPVEWGDKPAQGNAANPPPMPFGAPVLPPGAGAPPPQLPPGQDTVKQLPMGTVPDTWDMPCSPAYACLTTDHFSRVQVQHVAAQLADRLPTALRWVDPALYHVTLVYAPMMEDGQLQAALRLLPDSLAALTLHASQIAAFDNPADGGQAVHLVFDPSPALQALQRQVFQAFARTGTELSPFSDSDAFTPHLTLCYLPSGTPLPAGLSVDLDISLADLVISRDDYQTVQAKPLLRTAQAVATPSLAATKELERFATFAGKRLAGRRSEIDAFTFRQTTPGLAIAARAFVDLATGAHDLAPLVPYKATNRISLDGTPDPFGSEKDTWARRMAVATQQALATLRDRIVTGVRSVGSANDERIAAYFNAAFWKQAASDLSGKLHPLYTQATEAAATDSARTLEMSSGIHFDEHTLTAPVDAWADQWASHVPAEITDTTRAGLTSLLSRWNQNADATLNDLIEAVQNSPLFGASRAALIGDYETSRAFYGGTWIGLWAILNSVNVKAQAIRVPDDTLFPAHVGCRCFPLARLNTVDGKLQGEIVWMTVQDEKVCPVCYDRNGKPLDQVRLENAPVVDEMIDRRAAGIARIEAR